jgi:hypothetical protein
MPQRLAEQLLEAVNRELPLLEAMSEEQAAAVPAGATSWTRKQELGHLIDSAINNHVRFVRATLEGQFAGPSYNQNGWVELHDYNSLPWTTLLAFWAGNNALLTHLIASIPEDALGAPCTIGENDSVTLGFIMQDYILHMQHHLDHIVGRETLTTYNA